jgi:nucleoside-diphosphate-sugar epimerase
MTHIAILGATSQLGKNLIYFFEKEPSLRLSLFSRQAGNLHGFGEDLYDVVIHLIGFTGSDILAVNAQYDDMVLAYLNTYPDTRYIYASSGIVHSDNDDTYTHAKQESEAKHRALPDYAIVDIRIFSFFSRFIDVTAPFFMNAILKALRDKTPLHTTDLDFSRDYCDPEDFFRLILSIIQAPPTNVAIDLKSKAPISKFSLLAELKQTHHLDVVFQPSTTESATGFKKEYYATSDTAKKRFGFEAHYSSLDAIKRELTTILGENYE